MQFGRHFLFRFRNQSESLPNDSGASVSQRIEEDPPSENNDSRTDLLGRRVMSCPLWSCGTCLYVPAHALTHVVHQPGAEGRGGRRKGEGNFKTLVSP